MLAVDAMEVRPAPKTKGRVKIMRKAIPAMILIRPDDGEVTLRDKDRCMGDYIQSEVDGCLAVRIQVYDPYAADRDYEDKRRELPERLRSNRMVDLELEANSAAMSSMCHPEKFLRFDGTHIMTNAELRKWRS